MAENNQDEKNLVAELVRFGITEQEADLFVLMSKIRQGGRAWVAASEVYKIAGKDRVRVYQLLQRLLKLGLVETSFGRPKKYSPASPQTAIRRLMAIHELRLTELSHLEEQVVSSLRGISPLKVNVGERSEAQKQRPDIIYLQGLPNVQSELRKIMENQNLSLIVNDESYSHMINTIRYLNQKPKSTRLIVATPEENLGRRVRLTGLRRLRVARFTDQLPTFVLTDDECAFLFYSVRHYRPRPLSQPKVSSSVSDSIVVESRRYVNQMRGLFDALWNSAVQEK